MGGVDLVDQRTATYHLDRKSSVRFYLRIFFDLMDVTCANSYIVYNMLQPGGITLLNFKIAIATHLIGRYNSRNRAYPENNTLEKRKYRYQFQPEDIPLHLPEFAATRKQCKFCSNGDLDNKTFVECKTCGVHLCMVKERNCFKNYHS